jgi:hypothetical protein
MAEKICHELATELALVLFYLAGWLFNTVEFMFFRLT